MRPSSTSRKNGMVLSERLADRGRKALVKSSAACHDNDERGQIHAAKSMTLPSSSSPANIAAASDLPPPGVTFANVNLSSMVPRAICFPRSRSSAWCFRSCLFIPCPFLQVALGAQRLHFMNVRPPTRDPRHYMVSMPALAELASAPLTFAVRRYPQCGA